MIIIQIPENIKHFELKIKNKRLGLIVFSIQALSIFYSFKNIDLR